MRPVRARSIARAAFAVSALAMLGACLGGKRISDIDQPGAATPAAVGNAWSVPSGVAVAAGERGATVIDGLYPSTVPDDRRCCWLAPDATVRTNAPAGARTLALALLVPDYPFFEAHPQAVTITVAGTSHSYAGLDPGVHRLRIDLGGAAATVGILRVRIRSSEAFVPAREGVNADTRSLGIILLDIKAT